MIEKITKDLINKFIIEIQKVENQQIIEIGILGPIFSKFSQKIYPYVSLLFYMYILNLILIFVILILIIMFNKKN
jgi:uncharacterized membrane protein